MLGQCRNMKENDLNKITIRRARQLLDKGSEEEKNKVKQELEAIGASEITDVLSWNDKGQVSMNSSESLSHRARKAIKKVKSTPTQYGTSLEVEMHDKLSALRLLAKHSGLLEVQEDNNRPAVIGINLKGPEVATIKVKKNDEESD